MRANLRVHTWLAAIAGGLLVAGNVASAQTEHKGAAPEQKEPMPEQKEPTPEQKAGIAGEELGMESTIYFRFDSDRLDATAMGDLDEVAMWAKEHEDRKIIIAGHTDKIGTEAYNMELGGRRALSARKYLMDKGIPDSQITVLSFGETVPASERNAENRRVVFLAQRQEAKAAEEPIEQPSAPIAAAPEPYAPPAQPLPQEQPQPVSEKHDYLLTPAGMSFQVGGGVMNFIDDDTRDFTDIAGTWEARLTYGTRTPIGVEASYVGSAQDVDALGLDTSAVLLGSSAEAALRVNIPVVKYVTPYALGGVGVSWFNIVNEDFNDSSLDDSETAVSIPLSVGVGFTYEGFLFDVRGTYRPMFNDNLVDVPEDLDNDVGGNTDLDTWAATAGVGVEF